jgi:hypothetical protein
MSIPTRTNNHTVADDQRGQYSDSKSDALPPLLSLKQVQVLYGIPYLFVRGWVIDGLLHPFRLPGSRIKARGGRVVANSRNHRIPVILVDRQDTEQSTQEPE